MKNKAKLDQLTSLRFFAALMIVFHHAEGLFGLGPAPVNLGQGVSFFFVLSGFILAYVYPRLDGWAEIRRFWLARFARIWPVYVASFAFAYALLPFQWNGVIAAANLGMVQSWLPLSALYFSYNAVAWSISTEAFFYLAFPFLISNWRTTWRAKLIATLALSIGVMAFANWLNPMDYGNPYNGDDGWKVTMHGLIYVNPLVRLLEFVAGMLLAHLLAVVQPGRASETAPHRAAWTLLEVAAFLFCAGAMYWSLQWADVVRSHLGDAPAMWMIHSGGFLGFAAVVFAMACGGGAVSQALRWRPMVLLGEISFAMYLIHQTLMSVWRERAAAVSSFVPTWAATLIYFAILLALSYLTWRFLENPARRAILSFRARPRAIVASR
jgi:peptidoglycan/LPS O-acetylase OafA/YrhL